MKINLGKRRWFSFGFIALAALAAGGLRMEGGLERSAAAENNSTAGAIHNDGVQYILSRLPMWWRGGCICCCEPCPCDPPWTNLYPLLIQAGQDYAGQNAHQLGALPPADTTLDGHIDDMAGAGTISAAAQNKLHQISQIIGENSSATLTQFKAQLDQLDTEAAGELQANDLSIYQDASSVARASGMMWAREVDGGINGIKFMPDVPDPDQAACDIDWGHVVRMDLLGTLFGGPEAGAVASTLDIVDQVLDQL